MKAPRNRSELLLTVARLHYEQNLTKTAIAKKFRLSVTHIARLLEEARAADIVHIEFRGPRYDTLGKQLRSRYPWLREAIVIGTESDYLLQTQILARAAAEYFEEKLTERSGLVKV